MKKLFAILIFLLGIIYSESVAAQKYVFDIRYVSKIYNNSDKEIDLNDKYLEINILKGTSYQLPLMKVTLSKSSSTSNLTDVIWFEKGKSYYQTQYGNGGKFYSLYSTEFPNEGLTVFVPENDTQNGMVQFVHLNDKKEPTYDIAAFISRKEALRIESIIKSQLTNLNFKPL